MQQAESNPWVLCWHFGIRPTRGDRWLHRYAVASAVGSQNRSWRPRRSSAQTVPAIDRGMLARLGFQPLPAAATITAILRRHDAVDSTQGAGRPRRVLQRFSSILAPTPCGGWTPKLGGPVSPGRCHPLTILDGHSRYALGLATWQTNFSAWCHEYNHVRPHEAPALAIPASRYHVSPRPDPAQPTPLSYGPKDKVLKIQAGGRVPSHCHQLPLPMSMRGWSVAIRATLTDGCWAIRFLADDLSTLDLRWPA